jgi:hypothetical protein
MYIVLLIEVKTTPILCIDNLQNHKHSSISIYILIKRILEYTYKAVSKSPDFLISPERGGEHTK